MNEKQLNEILGQFTGNLKEDIDIFQSMVNQYSGTSDAGQVFNEGLKTLIGELNDDQREEFFDGLRKAGLDKYIKSDKAMKFGSVPDEDIVKLKKIIITGGKNVKQKPLTFNNAVYVGKPLVLSVPKELVEQLKQNRKEYLESHKEENEK